MMQDLLEHGSGPASFVRAGLPHKRSGHVTRHAERQFLSWSTAAQGSRLDVPGVRTRLLCSLLLPALSRLATGDFAHRSLTVRPQQQVGMSEGKISH